MPEIDQAELDRLRAIEREAHALLDCYSLEDGLIECIGDRVEAFRLLLGREGEGQ